MIEIGQRYRVHPVFMKYDDSEQSCMVVGRVAYIHPKGRFVELAFDSAPGTVRESFWPEQLTEQCRVRQKGEQECRS